MQSLSARYPHLAASLPWMPLGTLPTPVHPLTHLGARLGLDLYIKRDDLSGERYGGNKLRKLELLLAEARNRGCRSIVTVGFAGSNHVLATAIYSRQLGMDCLAVLMRQPSAPYVRKNLLSAHAAGARLYHHAGTYQALAALVAHLSLKYLAGKKPCYIAGGGTSSLSNAGYVNAAFELADQVERGEVPEPDLIYVPLASMGTAIGLAMGSKLAGMRTRVVGVRVTDTFFTNVPRLKKMWARTADYLHARDPAFPEVSAEDVLVVRDDLYGEGYALTTEASRQSVRMMQESEGLELDGTYTGKALAAIVQDADNGLLAGKRVLFWNTYNSRPLPGIGDLDYRVLPRAFHPYFEHPDPVLHSPPQG